MQDSSKVIWKTGSSAVALLAVLSLGPACDHKVATARPPVMSSSGLPPLWATDAGALAADAAVPVLDAASTASLPDAEAPDTALADRPAPADANPNAGGPDAATGALDAAADAPGLIIETDAAACTATSATAKPLPVDIYVVLDRSGSMTTPVFNLPRDGGAGFSGTRWTAVTEALGKFVMAPASAGLQVGLTYFPPSAFGTDQCAAASYATPVVPIAALPGVATPFMTSVNMTTPGGGTPTLPAIEGAVEYARQREMTMGRRTAIALATDGEPGSCGSSVQSVSDAAAMAAARGIFTFVIGVGPSLQALNAVAAAGGTRTAYLVENATPDELAGAFKAVQMQASRLACSFMVPPPPPGQTLDPYQVQVRFTPTANPTGSFDIGMVAGRTDCAATGGWYFDDVISPTSVNLCEASCMRANTAGEGSISLQFGCTVR